MPENRLEFRYNGLDVTSAQRMRFLHSPQFRLLLIFWAITFVFFVLHVLLPDVFRFFPGVTWSVIGQITLVYFVTFFAIMLVLPWLGFLFTRFWHLPLFFQFNSKAMRLGVVGSKAPGLRLRWDQIRRVEENRRVYIVYYDTDQKHFILPKSAFSAPNSERRWRDYLARYTTLGQETAPPQEASQEEPAVEDQGDLEE